MMKQLKNQFLTLLILVVGSLLASCSASPPPPTHYYLLDASQLPGSQGAQEPKFPVMISLDEVTLSAPFNSENLVVRLKNSEIQFYNYEKWSAPPAAMIQNFIHKALIYRNLFQITDRGIRRDNAYRLNIQFEEFAHNREGEQHYGNLRVFAGLKQNSKSFFSWYKNYHIQIPTESDRTIDVVKALRTGVFSFSQELMQDLEDYFSK